MKIRLAQEMLVATVFMVAPFAANAQNVTRIIVGFPPGGSVDIVARILADAMKDELGNIVVDNKPGASGRIAIAAVKSAKPDGHTLLLVPSGPMTMFPHIYKKLDYDPQKDFTPISQVARFQFGIAAGPSTGVKSIADMVAAAKSDPTGPTFGTPGLGSVPHFVGVMLEKTAGIKLSHVPFQGGAPVNTAVAGGHVTYKIDVVSESIELHRSGKATLIAVTGLSRDPEVPEVRTLKEQGVDMNVSAWFALYGPTQLPPVVTKRLEMAAVSAVASPKVREKLMKLGYEPVGSSAAVLASTQQADLTRWQMPIKSTEFSLD